MVEPDTNKTEKEELSQDSEEDKKNFCPNCGKDALMVAGRCITCLGCGLSSCSL